MDERDDWHLTQALHHEQGRGDPFAAAVRATRMAMVITDPNLPDNPIVFANDAFQRLTGYDRPEIVGRNCRFLQGPQTDLDSVARIRDAVGKGTDIAIDILNYRKDGTSFWNALYLSPVRDDDGSILFFFASQLDVTDRIDVQSRMAREKSRVEAEVTRRVAELRDSLDAQRLLLHEVDHRVKNNMTMIGSILRLQLREAADSDTADMLRAMMTRIDALATVHRHLYQADDVTRFDIGSYAVNLASDLTQSRAECDVRIRADLGRAEVPAGQAAAIGLIVNEILTHMIRLADAGQGQVFDISSRTTPARVELSIGFGPSGAAAAQTDPGYSPSGVNEQIIARLAVQTRTRVTWSRSDQGSIYVSVIIDKENP
ncbi:PAS domain-containing protein [Paracoccus sp. Ld10]|uniref:PAS domain-containing protein n=1 Tax=Paracoccus sp. Ld10 TaxID=649158 RepID=UPI0038700100